MSNELTKTTDEETESRTDRRSILKGFAGAGAFGGIGFKESQNADSNQSVTQMKNSTSDSPPNVLYIMSDDHTSQAISSYTRASLPTVNSRLGNLPQSSNIDRIGDEGARLNNCFATYSLCAPSRASILTGQYSHDHGIKYNDKSFDQSQPHMAKELQDAGYQTALIGKWHLGTDPVGFDYWNRLLGQGDYFNPILKEKEGGTNQYSGFSTDVITNQSLQWLQNQRDSDDPFLLMTQFKACHEDFRYPDRFAQLFEDVDIPEPSTLFEDKSHRSPGSRGYGPTIESMGRSLIRQHEVWDPDIPESEQWGDEFRRRAYQAILVRYLRSAAAIDDNVGRLLNYLEQEGLLDNTIIIYTSDQGYFLGEHNYVDKRWMYEEAIRMPFLIRYPPEIDAGTVVDDISLNIDFAPTILDYAGIEETPDYMQGESFRSNLRGSTPDNWRNAMYYRYWGHDNVSAGSPWGGIRPGQYGIRTDRYKLIFFYGLDLGVTDFHPTPPGIELYDLKEDPNETNNVYGVPEYEDVATRLKKKLIEKKQELGDMDHDPQLLARRRDVWGTVSTDDGDDDPFDDDFPFDNDPFDDDFPFGD